MDFSVDSGNTTGLWRQNLKIPGSAGLGSLFRINDTVVTITLPDLETSTPTATTSSAPGQGGIDFKNFLKLNPAELLTQFRSLTAQFGEISANVDIDIPFISLNFDDLVHLMDTFDAKVLSKLFEKTGDPTSNLPSFTSIQGLVTALSSSLNNLNVNYLIDLTNLGDFVTYDAVAKAVLFHFGFSKTFTRTDTLAAGFDLAAGLADLNFSTDASITASLSADITLGLDLKAAFDGAGPTEWVFLKDTSLTASITVAANNVDALARFGFIGIEIVDGTVSVNAAVTVSLTDPGVGPKANGRITIAELVSGLGNPSTLISFHLTGAALLQLPVASRSLEYPSAIRRQSICGYHQSGFHQRHLRRPRDGQFLEH